MGGYKVGRITGEKPLSFSCDMDSNINKNWWNEPLGLDPAGPKFLTAHRERRLDVGDATFVDVIHTSQLGYMTQIGHADFFRECSTSLVKTLIHLLTICSWNVWNAANGGLKQPNCVDPDFNLVQTISSLGTAIAGIKQDQCYYLGNSSTWAKTTFRNLAIYKRILQSHQSRRVL